MTTKEESIFIKTEITTIICFFFSCIKFTFRTVHAQFNIQRKKKPFISRVLCALLQTNYDEVHINIYTLWHTDDVIKHSWASKISSAINFCVSLYFFFSIQRKIYSPSVPCFINTSMISHVKKNLKQKKKEISVRIADESGLFIVIFHCVFFFFLYVIRILWTI